MVKCWASALGECGSASREHYITESLWLGNTIKVEGFSWCKEIPVEIGLSSATAKILCREHNSLLSATDAEAKKAFEAFRDGMRLMNERKENPSAAWPNISFLIDGILLERWFLKTLINIVTLQPRKDLLWFGTERFVDNPPEHIVRVAYGRKKFLWPKGLYAAATLNQSEHSDESVSFSPLIHEETTSIAGGIFTFRGWRFLLYFGRKPLPEQFDLPKTGLPSWKSSILRYRLKCIEWTLEEGRQSHAVHFIWR